MQSSASLQSSPLGAERGANHGKETGIANLTEFQVLPQLIPQEQMNGESSVPVQHGYTNNSTEVLPKKDVAGLKNQFQSLQISSGESSGMDPKLFRANVRSDDNDGDSEDPVKLFVGQVPKTMNEVDIFPTFDSFGPLKDVAIIRDKHTGLHRGCAFVTYFSSDNAANAQQALHDTFTFPGGKRTAQVKPADPAAPENKVFIGMLSRKAGEPEVREVFAQYGEIQEIYMIRNADGSSKCAAFLRFVKREAALKAIENLHNNRVMDGSARPLIVKFADTKQQRHARNIRNTRREQLMAVMGDAGPTYPEYHVPQVSPTIGISHTGHQYSIPQFPTAYHGSGAPMHPHHPYMYPPHQFGHTAHYAFQSRPEMRAPNPRPREGPAGANLFVYHLPHDLADADLTTAFNPFGNVISAKVYVDRYTGESKGFGFVSYDSVMSAESAIDQMNGVQIGNKRLKVQHKRVNNMPGVNHLLLG